MWRAGYHPRGFIGRGVTIHPVRVDHGLMDTDAGQAPAASRRYRIWVVGRLDERFVDGLDGIELGGSEHGSTLEGPFVDQSQLRGVLDRLWQLGIEVFKFETYLPGIEEAQE